ncbi:MAG TPA: hypothetical protein DDZ58_02035 [Achromobacter sp.]|nr:hypothetical protein [Achromobacter sp.]
MPWPSITTDDREDAVASGDVATGAMVCPARITVTGVLSGATPVAPANELIRVMGRPQWAVPARVFV